MRNEIIWKYKCEFMAFKWPQKKLWVETMELFIRHLHTVMHSSFWEKYNFAINFFATSNVEFNRNSHQQKASNDEAKRTPGMQVCASFLRFITTNWFCNYLPPTKEYLLHKSEPGIVWRSKTYISGCLISSVREVSSLMTLLPNEWFMVSNFMEFKQHFSS